MLLSFLCSSRDRTGLFDKIGFTSHQTQQYQGNKHRAQYNTRYPGIQGGISPEACRPCLILAPLLCPLDWRYLSPSQAENVLATPTLQVSTQAGWRKVLLLCMCSIPAILGTHLFLRWLVLEITALRGEPGLPQGLCRTSALPPNQNKIQWPWYSRRNIHHPLASSSASFWPSSALLQWYGEGFHWIFDHSHFSHLLQVHNP